MYNSTQDNFELLKANHPTLRDGLRDILARQHGGLDMCFDQTLTYDAFIQFAAEANFKPVVALHVWQYVGHARLCENDPRPLNVTVQLGVFARQSHKQLLGIDGVGKRGIEFLGLFLVSKGTSIGAAETWTPLP